MSYLVRSAFVALLVLGLGGYAHAGTINFITLTEDNPGGYGEGAWSSLVLNVGGATVTITGHATDDSPAGDILQYAYLDWGNAGLGVCKDVVSGAPVNNQVAGRTSNSCKNSSDDNVTTNEYLKFVFDRDVTVNNLWFNNNHDGGFGMGDMVKIDGTDYPVVTGYAGGINGRGPFTVSANSPFLVAFSNEQFYISGMEVTAVPDEATTLALLSAGMCLLFALKLRVG
jgi:hypothetical protein